MNDMFDIKNILNINETKEFEKVIKNPDCHFTNENNDLDEYYFCFCSEDPYFPICRHCAFKCHKNHDPQVKLYGYFNCMCGENNHVITEKDNQKYEKEKKKLNFCFYNEFLKKSLHKEISVTNLGKKLCSICIDIGCENNAVNNNLIEFNSTGIDDINICHCMNHDEINVVTFRKELNLFNKVNEHLFNFNFNIFFVSRSLKRIFIDFLNQKLIELKSDIFGNQNISKNNLEVINLFKKTQINLLKNEKNIFKNFLNKNQNEIYNKQINNKETSKKYLSQINSVVEFYTDYVNNTLFSIFYLVKKNYSSKFLHYRNILDIELKPKDLLKIFSDTLLHQKILENNEKFDIYINTKINFGLILFNIYIKSHFLNFNNLLNLKSVLNLNIFQRYLYLNDSKNFYKIANYNNENTRKDIPFKDFEEKITEWQLFIFEFAKSLLEILELINLFYLNKDNLYRITGKNIEPICQIFKFLIKYNLIDKEQKIKYFELIEETIRNLIYDYKKINGQLNKFLADLGKNINLYGLNKSQIEKILNESQNKKFNDLMRELDYIKDNIWFLFHVIKSNFYFLLKNNDDIILEKFKINNSFNSNCSSENYSFQNSEMDDICKILLISIYLFTEVVYSSNNKDSIYKRKILKVDLYIKKILELLIGNNEFYIKSIESILHEYDKKIDNLFIQDFVDEKNNFKKYIEYLNTPYMKKIVENFTRNNEINLKMFYLGKDIYKEIINNIDTKLLSNFNLINFEFGILNKNFYTYEIDFIKYMNGINNIFSNLQKFVNLFNSNNILNIEIFESKNNIEINNFSCNDEKNDKQSLLISQRDIENKNIIFDDDNVFKNDNLFSNLTDFKKIEDFKHLIGYTDFIENINEFLDIYSKANNFSKELKDININKKNIRFILKFILLLTENNFENISLIMSLNPIKFVQSFIEYKLEMVEFIEKISKIIVRYDYFDNYYFLTEVINNLLIEVNLKEENENIITDVKVFTGILYAFKRMFQKYKIYNNEIINTFELIQEKIKLIKKNSKMMDLLNNYFYNLKIQNTDKKTPNSKRKQSEEENENLREIYDISKKSDDFKKKFANYSNEKIILKENGFKNKEKLCEKKSMGKSNKTHKKKYFDVLIKFLKNYFFILNVVIEKDLFYYNYLDNPDFILFDAKDLMEKIKENQFIDLMLREEIEKYLHFNNLKISIKFSNLETKFAEFQYSLLNDNLNKRNTQYENITSKLDFSYLLLKDQIKNFNNNTNFVKFKKNIIFMKKVFAYVEYSIINPLYKLVNLFFIEKKSLLGEDYFKLYELIYFAHYFLLNIYDIMNSEKEEEYTNENSHQHLHISAYRYSDLKIQLDTNEMENLKINTEIVENLKYFELEKLVNIFRVTLILIKKNNTFNKIHLKKKICKYNIIENTHLDGYDDIAKDEIFKNYYDQIIFESQKNLLKSEERNFLNIIKDFKNNLSNCFGNEFCLIKCLEEDNSDSRLNFRHVLLDYIFNKFSDKLTEANKNIYIPQNKYTFNKFYDNLNNNLDNLEINSEKTKYFYRNYTSPENLKIQNFYVIFYLRNLFFFDPQKFQHSLFSLVNERDGLEEIDKKKCIEKDIVSNLKLEYFLNLLNKYFVYGNIVLEINKIYELSSERNLLIYELTFDFLISSIFFIQNICEGHEQKYQNILYNLRLFPYNYSNSNKDNQIKNKEEQNEENNFKMINPGLIKEIELGEKFFQNNKDLIFSYVNFNCNLMKMIVSNQFFDDDEIISFPFKTFRNNTNLITIYTKLSDLLIEMIQGCEEINLFYFFKPDLENKSDILIPSAENYEIYKEYQFLILLQNSKEFLTKLGENNQKEISNIKRMNFSIINNILKHENMKYYKINVIDKIYDINSIMKNICYYMDRLVIRYQNEILYEHPQINSFIKNLNYQELNFIDLYEICLQDFFFFEDEYFKVCIEMYYYIYTLGDKFSLEDSLDVMNLGIDFEKKKNLKKIKTNHTEMKFINDVNLKINFLENKLTCFYKNVSLKKKHNVLEKAFFNTKFMKKSTIVDLISVKNNNTKENVIELENKNLKHHYTQLFDNNKNQISENTSNNQMKNNNKLYDFYYSKAFLSKIIRSIEFVIDNNGLKIKEVYFINQPQVYLVNKINRIKFFEQLADRTDATTKITSLLDEIENFEIEINYKLDILDNNIKLFLIDINYKRFDFLSLIISITINLFLLITLTSDNFKNTIDRSNIEESVLVMGLLQLLINILGIAIFTYSKYNLTFYYCLNNLTKQKFSYLNKKNLKNKKNLIFSKLNLYDKTRLYILDSFLFNEDINLILFNTITGLFGIIKFEASFLFILQLITIARFLSTLRDIINAFRSRFDQLMTLVLFLLILIYFYSNVGFYFLVSEFDGRGTGHSGGNPEKENACRSLIRCFIYFFNEGVRSGGGIGDLLDIKSWDDIKIFYFRWFVDVIFFITVILLLLNMINGVIVSTFSAIREEKDKSNEDKDNKCYICSIDKSEFEKRKIKFKKHIEEEHKLKDYINYILNLKLKKNKDLDSNEIYIKQNIINRNIDVFPIFRAKSLGGNVFKNLSNEDDETKKN